MKDSENDSEQRLARLNWLHKVKKFWYRLLIQGVKKKIKVPAVAKTDRLPAQELAGLNYFLDHPNAAPKDIVVAFGHGLRGNNHPFRASLAVRSALSRLVIKGLARSQAENDLLIRIGDIEAFKDKISGLLPKEQPTIPTTIIPTVMVDTIRADQPVQLPFALQDVAIYFEGDGRLTYEELRELAQSLGMTGGGDIAQVARSIYSRLAGMLAMDQGQNLTEVLNRIAPRLGLRQRSDTSFEPSFIPQSPQSEVTPALENGSVVIETATNKWRELVSERLTEVLSKLDQLPGGLIDGAAISKIFGISEANERSFSAKLFGRLPRVGHHLQFTHDQAVCLIIYAEYGRNQGTLATFRREFQEIYQMLIKNLETVQG